MCRVALADPAFYPNDLWLIRDWSGEGDGDER